MTATPVEFDTALAAKYQDLYRAQDTRDQMWSYAVDYVHHANDRTGYRATKFTTSEVRDILKAYVEEDVRPEGYRQSDYADKAVEYFERYEAAQDKADEIGLEIAEFNDAFRARGGWTRAYLVLNSNGHVHSSMHCSTCFPTTRYHWLTQVSDHSEDEIVEKAGERACTVCYPSAPVEVLASPTQFFTPDEEEKQRAREEREQKRAAKAAAEIRVTGLQGWTNEGRGTHVFKTLRAATNDLSSTLSSLGWYGESHPSAPEWKARIEKIREVLDARGEEYDYDKILTNVRKKITREGGSSKI